MLDYPTITELAEKIVRKRIAEGSLERVLAGPAVDSVGIDALRLTLVLTPHAAETMTGDEALDVLSEIQTKFRAKGEMRFPSVGYATQQELDAEASENDADLEEYGRHFDNS